MTLEACIARAVADGHADPVQSARAQALPDLRLIDPPRGVDADRP